MTERAETGPRDSAPSWVLLTLIAPVRLEEPLADLLLEAPELVGGFTSSSASGHGAGVHFEAASERVRGRGRRVRFDIAIDRTAAEALLDRMQAEFSETHLYYWICPMLECGILGRRARGGAQS